MNVDVILVGSHSIGYTLLTHRMGLVVNGNRQRVINDAAFPYAERSRPWHL